MRGQTTLDFVTGVGVFLLTVLFVFAFVPGVMTPFTQSAQEETVGADRIADLVVTDVVADSGRSYRLDGACTARLLSDRSGGGCGFDGGTLPARLDLGAGQSVNITLRGTAERDDDALLCWNRDNESVVPRRSGACGPGDTVLRAGETPADDTDSVVSARRIVAVGGGTAILEVRLW